MEAGSSGAVELQRLRMTATQTDTSRLKVTAEVNVFTWKIGVNEHKGAWLSHKVRIQSGRNTGSGFFHQSGSSSYVFDHESSVSRS